MLKTQAAAVILLFTGSVYAQQQRTETTTTTKTTWNGTLIDESCHTSHSQTKESKTSDQGVTRTQTTTTIVTECPITTTTTKFGLFTGDGKYLRFDAPSNSKIVQIVKSNKNWETEMNERRPVIVRVVGTAAGDVVVLESVEEGGPGQEKR